MVTDCCYRWMRTEFLVECGFDAFECCEKLKKQIHDSINSYSLDNANSEDKTSPKNLKTVIEAPSDEAAPADEEISDFSSDI